jgi:hypothetical protein
MYGLVYARVGVWVLPAVPIPYDLLPPIAEAKLGMSCFSGACHILRNRDSRLTAV